MAGDWVPVGWLPRGHWWSLLGLGYTFDVPAIYCPTRGQLTQALEP